MDTTKSNLADSFKLFDANNDGYITLTEFTVLARVLGVVSDTDEINNMYGGNSKMKGMNYQSFEKCFNELFSRSLNSDQLKESINVLDKTGKGFIPAAELRRILTTMGDSMKDQEVTELFHGMGIDEKGVVSMEDFVTRLTTVFE
ncbi:Calmodulin [Entamoeba marina]